MVYEGYFMILSENHTVSTKLLFLIVYLGILRVFNYILQVVDIAALIGHKHCWLVLECYRGWSLLCSPHNASWQLLKCLKVDGSSTQSMYLMDPYNIMEICLGRLTLIHAAVSSGAGMRWSPGYRWSHKLKFIYWEINQLTNVLNSRHD